MMNKNDSADSFITFTTQKVTYKGSCSKREVSLEFQQFSQFFLQSIHITRIKSFEELLREYTIKSVSDNKVIFQKGRGSSPEIHTQFIKRIQRLLSNYNIFIICQGYSCSKKLIELQKKIALISNQIGVSKQMHSFEEKKKKIFVYFPSQLQQQIKTEVIQYISTKRYKFIYPLNQYIGKTIPFQHYKEFVGKMHQVYKKQLKQICSGKYNKKKIDVNIISVCPNLISKENRQSEWSQLQGKAGIIGLEFQIEGQEYEILRLYSLLQAFFQNKYFGGYKLQDYKQVNGNEIKSKLEKHGLKTILIPQYFVIFQYPPNLQSILYQLHQKIWTISSKDFPNFKFNIIDKQKSLFVRTLRSKQLNFQDLRLYHKCIEFQSDRETYQKVKKFCRHFILEMQVTQSWIPFIGFREDVQIIKQYYLQNCKFQLNWTYDGAVMQCRVKDEEQCYEKLVQINKLVSKKKLKIYSRVQIQHKLIRCERQVLKYNFFASWNCKSNRNGFSLMVRQMDEIYEESLVLVIVRKYEQTMQIKQLILRNCGTSNLSSLSSTEVLTKQQAKLQSIFLLQISNVKSVQKAQSTIVLFLEEFVARNKPFRIALPREKQYTCINLLKIILKHLQFRKSAIEVKDIYLYIPSNNQNDFRNELRKQIIQYGFNKVNNYQLNHRQMVEASTLSLVTMSCRIDSRNVKCTSLNSFIFQHQICSKQNKQFQLAIFIPKITCQQYLVSLKNMQIYRINHYKVQKVDNFAFFQKLIVLLKRFFINQDYVVLYCKQINEQSSLLSYFYIYNSINANILKKVNLGLDNQKMLLTQYRGETVLYV